MAIYLILLCVAGILIIWVCKNIIEVLIQRVNSDYKPYARIIAWFLLMIGLLFWYAYKYVFN